MPLLNLAGFRLSATVDQNRCNDSGNGFHVTVYFDRGKITSAHCSCDQPTNWCVHVIATCLARIKDKNTVTIRMPVSDSLNFLDRDQLIKFAQYLLYEHQNESIIETAQQLLDKLLSKEQQGQEEDINAIAGAPDPTAGPGKAVYQHHHHHFIIIIIMLVISFIKLLILLKGYKMFERKYIVINSSGKAVQLNLISFPVGLHF